MRAAVADLMSFQKRPWRVVTGCSGTEAPLFALQAVGISFEAVASADPKKSAMKFAQQNLNATHHVELIQHFFIEDSSTSCTRHIQCDMQTALKGMDIFVAGFPCAPFSAYRPKRRKSGCTDHPHKLVHSHIF
jgi:site-specific DNA-cytosine methylase